ncbi:hypothetical protein G6F60_014143 [Rhizopus arrhizus]|nr:hypothetical protein G6F60_014143 [Rhizopus arrhizus]
MICQQLAGFFGLLPGSTLRALLLGRNDVDGQGAYRARDNRIQDLADPKADQDAVNRRSMFAYVTDYVDKAIAGVVGGFGWFLQTGMGAIFRTFQAKMRDRVSVLDFGAIGDGTYHPLSERLAALPAAQAQYPFVTDLAHSIDYAAIQAALDSLEACRPWAACPRRCRV